MPFSVLKISVMKVACLSVNLILSIRVQMTIIMECYQRVFRIVERKNVYSGVEYKILNY